MVMIFVNYGGGGYWFFNHSRWNGLTVADLVFPWFVWIMGVAIVFSYKGRRKDSLFSRLYQIVRRTVILFGLGLFLNNGNSSLVGRCRGGVGGRPDFNGGGQENSKGGKTPLPRSK